MVAVAALVAVRRALRALPIDRLEQLAQKAEQVIESSGPTSELVTAWAQFVRDHVTDAVNGLNNRLNAIHHWSRGLQSGKLNEEQQNAVERIGTEVERATNITSSLVHRVTADAPNIPPPAWHVLHGEVPKPSSVLVVDSDDSNRAVVTMLLRGLGHDVTPVANGREAWDFLARRSVDCILCDVRMPALGGRTLYEQVEEQMPQLARRFVFVTGDFARPESYEFLLQSGQPVVGKPYELDTLLSAIAAVLSTMGSVRRDS